MKKQMLAISAIALLAACQSEERGNNKTSADMNSDDMTASDGTESDEVLAERSVEGVDDLGADIKTGTGNDEENEDINMPANTRYATYYLGSYAPDGKCSGPEKYVELDQSKITYSGTSCEIKAINRNGNSLSVTTGKCMKDGKAAPDASYTLELSDLENLKVTGSQNASLKRCGSG